MEDLSNYRKSYEKSQLLENAMPEEPIHLFQQWFQELQESGGSDEVNAMTVSTIGIDGYPKARVVLLKKFDDEGFIFFTNYNSDKGKSILQNPQVCLSFFWHALERQVIIKGVAEKTSELVSDDYFASRPEGSRLGAIVSNQSEEIADRSVLENRLTELQKEFAGKEIPRPSHWGGFLVRPVEVEFWQGRANRLHDRILYRMRNDFTWHIHRLAP